jgi:hypothetical protein
MPRMEDEIFGQDNEPISGMFSFLSLIGRGMTISGYDKWLISKLFLHDKILITLPNYHDNTSRYSVL